MPAEESETYHLRVPPALYEAMKADAEKTDRSINYRVIQILAAHYGLDVKPKTPGGKRVKGEKASVAPSAPPTD